VVQLLWLGCGLTLILLYIRFMQLRRKKTSQTHVGVVPLWLALLPFALAVVHMWWGPASASAQYVAENAAYKTSGMTAAEWVASRANDARAHKSASTSVLCALIISGFGVYNTQYSIAAQRSKTSSTP
jgi:hypothetical protein